VHHAKVLKDEWEGLNIEPVWNVAYRFDYNQGE